MPKLRLAAPPLRNRLLRLSALFGDGPVPIQTPADMADLLRAASPGTASAYARTMHELACSRCDEERLAFWAEVLRLVADAPARPASLVQSIYP